MTLIEWLTERRDNTARIAATKTGTDRAGWLEDQKYFQDAIVAAGALGEARERFAEHTAILNADTERANVRALRMERALKTLRQYEAAEGRPDGDEVRIGSGRQVVPGARLVKA